VAYSNLGNALQDQGQLDESLAAYRKALSINPAIAAAHSNLAFTMNFHPGYDAAAILDEHRSWSRRHAELLPRFKHTPPSNPASGRRLRIGYVSPDFREHCQSFFTTGLLANHDRDQFEIFCYSSVAHPDHITRRLMGFVEQWRPVAGMSDAKLAETIYADRIDILVDLTMHMSQGRPLMFARKPAPVQVAWLAYPGTTGLPAMDYRLTDPHLDPPGETDQFYTEKSIRLPDAFWCYDPLTTVPAVNELPALKTGNLTFGCLNNFRKLNDDTVALWSQVLRQVDNSRLLLLSAPGQHRQRVHGRFSELGVDPQRVEFIPYQPRASYLTTYHRIDIGLDTFPYNGHTTSLDSFWMGVPVVTYAGSRATGRAGLCHVSNLGLTELAGRSPDEFMRQAVKMSGDLPGLARLRSELRGRMERSPLMNAPRFARNMEAAFRVMWEGWCKTGSQKPAVEFVRMFAGQDMSILNSVAV
jgi:predicted O-linked N-acetylglucosamine transferase (SPINDLY family)